MSQNEARTLRNMKIPRQHAIVLVASAAITLGMLCVDEIRLELGLLGVVCLALFMGYLSMFGLLTMLPDAHWQYGVETHDEGFFFHQQLRRKKYIRYASIERIVVSSCLDGAGESCSTWRVESPDGNARLDESILYHSDMHAVLKALPGFDLDALARSDVPEGSLLWSIIFKKTVVLDRRGR